MIITTSQSIEDQKISEYLGIVSAAVVTAMPGGAKAVQRGWKSGVDEACKLLGQQAVDLGADAVIAVNMQLQGMNLCTVGTAVKFAKE